VLSGNATVSVAMRLLETVAAAAHSCTSTIVDDLHP
jgi:hypothetical protein